jgi:transposase
MAVQIATETDIERLRQIALLQQAELDRLYRRLATLTAELAQARGTDATAALQLELDVLREQLAARPRALVGPSSEQRPRGMLAPGPTRRADTPRPGPGPRPQPQLPLVEQVHVLEEPDRLCPKCGGALREMTGQYEEADEIDVVARAFQLVRHKRQKYTCRCGACVETALGPPKLMPGGRYSVNVAIEVAVAKYLDHQPLARQARQMRRAGLEVDRQTLWDQLAALAAHLAPTGEALHAQVLAAPVILVDETRWPLLGTAEASRWHAWAVACEDALSYRIRSSRSAAAAAEVLGTFTGTAVTDGHAAYEALRKSRDGPAFTLAHCWTHVRRKFVDAEPEHPPAAAVLEQIGALYAIEAQGRDAPAADRLARLAELRRTASAPIVAEIFQWLTTTPTLPRSGLGTAIAYTRQLWPGLVRFLEDPRLPLDTNAVERGMRAVAIGRKNHYGSRSERGTRVAALFYTLLETAKLCGLEPGASLTEATHRAIATPGTVTLPRDLHSA